MAVLVSNAGAEDFDTFLKSYRVAFEMPLDELEDIMRLRNALAEKAHDDNEDEIKRNARNR